MACWLLSFVVQMKRIEYSFGPLLFGRLGPGPTSTDSPIGFRVYKDGRVQNLKRINNFDVIFHAKFHLSSLLRFLVIAFTYPRIDRPTCSQLFDGFVRKSETHPQFW
ncbi:hypothetical protein AVEN_220663-1 [Araneus ventricosus]|uniref:Uncharacterized protein n=1 Tax=Araneus ventricosus TaxID=182803 RepID=A0A4Y2WSJ3_ARAVE|nr:hypothetical protein AVEN_220663-1 [Araneus ventricosus]